MINDTFENIEALRESLTAGNASGISIHTAATGPEDDSPYSLVVLLTLTDGRHVIAPIFEIQQESDATGALPHNT